MMGENNVGGSSANLDSGILDIVESRIQNKKEDEEKKEKMSAAEMYELASTPMSF